MRLPRMFLWVAAGFATFLPMSLQAVQPKTILVSVPLITLGRDAALRAEYNMKQAGTLGMEWTEWGMGKRQQELTQSEQAKTPNDGILTRGRELGVMWSRYNDANLMSGFGWGLGAGYRVWQAQWLEEQTDKSILKDDLESRGVTLTGRVGYRYVAPSLGLSVGAYTSIKHFQNQLRPNEAEESALNNEEQASLRRRLATSLRIGVEFGWAF
jgi:hypothetical protein